MGNGVGAVLTIPSLMKAEQAEISEKVGSFLMTVSTLARKESRQLVSPSNKQHPRKKAEGYMCVPTEFNLSGIMKLKKAHGLLVSSAVKRGHVKNKFNRVRTYGAREVLQVP